MSEGPPPSCFGAFRSPQSDAENDCEACRYNARCAFITKHGWVPLPDGGFRSPSLRDNLDIPPRPAVPRKSSADEAFFTALLVGVLGYLCGLLTGLGLWRILG